VHFHLFGFSAEFCTLVNFVNFFLGLQIQTPFGKKKTRPNFQKIKKYRQIFYTWFQVGIKKKV
jgi:hypothetical protein